MSLPGTLLKLLRWKRMRLAFAVVWVLGTCITRADVFYDFETPATSLAWIGTTQLVQHTSASYEGTNAIAFTGNYPSAYIMTELPPMTTNVEFYFYDEYGPNPPLYQYEYFRLMDSMNLPGFAGFSMLDGGWGTTPPQTSNHYYAWGDESYDLANMGPVRSVGWHKFRFAINPQSVAMSVDDVLIFQTNLTRVARFLEIQFTTYPWGRMDNFLISTAMQLVTAIPNPTNGGGVTGAGAFTIGSQVQLSANPNPGWAFTGWNDGNNDNPRSIIVPSNNLAYAANFALVPVAANYSRLFYDTNGVALPSSGAFTLAMTTKGTFSAKLRRADGTHSFSGKFSPTGSSSNSVSVKGSNPLSVQLGFNLGGTDVLNGQVSEGNWTAALVANRTVYSKSNAAPQSGKYTLLFPRVGDPSSQPGGDGFGAVTVNASGNLTFKGKLGDGASVSQAAVVSGQSQWPLFIPLYSGKGSVIGWLDFANRDVSDIDGAVVWTKLPQSTARLYPQGFTGQIETTGSLFQFTNGVPLLSFTDGELSLTDGNLTESLTNQFTLAPNGKVTGPNRLALSVSPASGLIAGSIVNPTTRKAIPVYGAVLQKQNAGAGYFLGTSESGEVFLGPVP